MLQEYKATENTWLIIRDLEDFKLPVLLLKEQELITKKPVIEEYFTRTSFLNRLTELEIPYGVNDYLAPPYATSTKFKPVYKILRTLTVNDTYYSVCNVISNGGNSSGVELVYEGSNGNEILIGSCNILANSTNYIFIEGEAGGTKQLAIRVKSDGNDNFIIQAKTVDCTLAIPILFNIIPHTQENIKTSDLTVYTQATLDQTFLPDTKVINSTNNPSIKIKGELVWHSGNDGSGSGLNADLLDGMQPNPLNVSNSIVARDVLGNVEVNYIEGSTSKASVGNDSDLLASTAFVQQELDPILANQVVINDDLDTLNTNVGILTNRVDDIDADIIEIQESTASTPEQILIKLLTVDGPGSTLDADSVDGIQGNSIVVTTGNQNIAGHKIFTGDVTVQGTFINSGAPITFTSLGATTPGINLITLPLVSQISYLQVNANNTVSSLQAPTFQQNITNNSLLNSSVATTDSVVIDSWDLNIYRSAKYIIQIVQGTDIQTSEMLVTHIDSTVIDTEYAVLMNNGRIAQIEADKTVTHVRLVINMLSNISANIKVNKKLILI